MHRHVHGRPQQVKIYMFLFLCSYETSCINCTVCIRDRNSAQIPDVSLRFVNKYIFRKLSQMYHVFVLKKNKQKKNPFQKRNNLQGNRTLSPMCRQAGFTYYLQFPSVPLASCINNLEQVYLTVKKCAL